jgi:uncharacterized iron-regulated membrane protein
MHRRLLAIHRWVSLFAFLQLLAWTTSGLFFSATSERAVKSSVVAKAHDRALEAEQVTTPVDVVAQLSPDRRALVRKIELYRHPEIGLVYIVRGEGFAERFDAKSATALLVSEEEAIATARRDQEGQPGMRSVALIRDAPIEYRGRPLPAFRVVLGDDESTVVYIDASTGEVTARRTDTWRVYDFLWSLHIMDYSDREDFRSPLLVAFAVIALATAISGCALWIVRLVRRRKRPARPAVAA